MSYVDELKELLMEYVKLKSRGDIEDRKKRKDGEGKCIGWIGRCGMVKVFGDGIGFEIRWMDREEKNMKEKGELWRILNMGEENVLVLGELFGGKIGLFSCCVCVYYEKGEEYWSGDDVWLVRRLEFDDEWSDWKLKGSV